MCGVFGQVKLGFKSDFPHKAKRALEERILKTKGSFKANYNIWTGMDAYVITSDHPEYYQSMQFGLTPSWSQKRLYLFNARAEGRYNKENEMTYDGLKGIHEMPSFRDAIMRRRCIIPVDYFIEGPEKEKLQKPYLIHQKNKKAFLLAGIWEEWIDKDTAELIRTFSIITTASNPLLQKLPHHRSPLVLKTEDLDTWLDERASREEIDQLLKPFDPTNFELYEVSPKIKTRQNERSLFLSVQK